MARLPHRVESAECTKGHFPPCSIVRGRLLLAVDGGNDLVLCPLDFCAHFGLERLELCADHGEDVPSSISRGGRRALCRTARRRRPRRAGRRPSQVGRRAGTRRTPRRGRRRSTLLRRRSLEVGRRRSLLKPRLQLPKHPPSSSSPHRRRAPSPSPSSSSSSSSSSLSTRPGRLAGLDLFERLSLADGVEETTAAGSSARGGRAGLGGGGWGGCSGGRGGAGGRGRLGRLELFDRALDGGGKRPCLCRVCKVEAVCRGVGSKHVKVVRLLVVRDRSSKRNVDHKLLRSIVPNHPVCVGRSIVVKPNASNRLHTHPHSCQCKGGGGVGLGWGGGGEGWGWLTMEEEEGEKGNELKS